jgi:type II secretory pathway predicted ATPase ExeA
MRRILSSAAIALVLACGAQAAEIQGVIADWNCVNNMVKNGREKTLRQDHSCSLMKNFKRQSYGLITDDKKFYRLDDAGKQQVIQVLQDSSDRDNLRVLVRGDLDGNTIKINNLTIL